MIKKIFFTVIAFVLIVSCFSAYGSANGSFSWYTVRNKDHKQPRLDAPLSFIEKYDAIYVDKAHGDNSEEKVIYLTFDVGYENGNVEKILNVLKEEDVTGAFFILGNIIVKNPELIDRMMSEGHLICNHSYHHPDMTKLGSFEKFKQEISFMEDTFRNTTGKDIAKFYRPPEGRFDEKTLSYAKEMGYKTVFWSFAYADWDKSKQPDPTAAFDKIMSNVHNGAIMLFHPTSATNAAIMKDVILELKAQGYRFATLNEIGG